MKVTCKFFYEGEPVEWIDENLRKLMETYGWEWYAQGYNLESGERDIVFDRIFPLDDAKSEKKKKSS